MTTLYERAAIIPGRSLTRSKAIFQRFGQSAYGAVITDTDGYENVDMLCGLGAISLWNGDGGVMSLPHQGEVTAAEAVLAHVAPWASSVRFMVSGSEACHAAYRIAKKATGKSRVFIGDWAYHGWLEQPAGAETFKHGELPPESEDIAAVFVEPHRWEPVSVEWLRSVRAFCDRVGALLVIDEMIYGGRWALGGATEYFGVIPDLACFGKAFGNGLPVAFVVGNAALAEHGTIVSGTYSGWRGGLEAVEETIVLYVTEPVIETLWARGRQLQEGLRQVIPVELGACEGQPVHQRVRFFNPDHGEAFMHAMFRRGVLWHPACANVMYAHAEAQIDQVITAAQASVGDLR